MYPTRECKITDCIVNGSINVETAVLLAGGIVGDIFVTNNAKLKFERLQTNTDIQVRGDSIEAGAISGSVLGRGEESFSDFNDLKNASMIELSYPSLIEYSTAEYKGEITLSTMQLRYNFSNKEYDGHIYITLETFKNQTGVKKNLIFSIAYVVEFPAK